MLHLVAMATQTQSLEAPTGALVEFEGTALRSTHYSTMN